MGDDKQLSPDLAFEKWLSRNWPWLVEVAVVAVVGCALVLGLSRWLGLWYGSAVSDLRPAEKVEAVGEVRTTMLQVVGGAAVLWGLVLNARRIREASKQTAEAARQNELTRLGQTNERFARATEQLGSSETFVRIGGIYSLESVARDSEELWGPAMETLTAYVREKRPWRDDADGAGVPILPEEIQVVLTVIGRSTRPQGCDTRLDLSGTNLTGARLKGSGWAGADLSGADLSRADLFGGGFPGAVFVGADLSDADLTTAGLQGADLSSATLVGADLMDADLADARLMGADLAGASFLGAKLSGTDFTGANRWGEAAGLPEDVLAKLREADER